MRIVSCHVPIILSVHIYLGALLWSWQLGSACNTARYFISENFTLPHCRCSLTACTFLCSRIIDPYIRRFVRCFHHSHHIYFIDPRHIGSTIHLWTAFVENFHFPYGCSLPTSPSFWQNQFPNNASRSIRGGVSRRYPIIPPLGLSVLLIKKTFHVLFLVPNLFN